VSATKETGNRFLYGVTVAMVTPFRADGSVDYAGVRNLVDFLIEKGVHCLYPLGTTGEMFRLTFDERMKVAETVVKHAAGRVTVFVHVGAMQMSDTIGLAQHAEQIGADGIGAVSPVYFKVTEREMIEYYVAIAGAVSDTFPVYLYGIPQLAVNDITAPTASEIASRHRNIVGIKYSYPDFQRTAEYLRINKGSFSVMQGTDTLFLQALAMGCSGTVSGCASVFPEPFVAVWDAYQRSAFDECRVLQEHAARFGALLQYGANMALFKEGLRVRGIIESNEMRRPQLPLDESQMAAFRNALDAIDRQ